MHLTPVTKTTVGHGNPFYNKTQFINYVGDLEPKLLKQKRQSK